MRRNDNRSKISALHHRDKVENSFNLKLTFKLSGQVSLSCPLHSYCFTRLLLAQASSPRCMLCIFSSPMAPSLSCDRDVSSCLETPAVFFRGDLCLYRGNGCAAHGSAESVQSALTRHIFLSGGMCQWIRPEILREKSHEDPSEKYPDFNHLHSSVQSFAQ